MTDHPLPLPAVPKIISIRAPWWWFILHAGKDIENRDWPTRYRGPVLIHASKWWNLNEVAADSESAAEIARSRGVSGVTITYREMRALGGCIVGRAEIVDCVSESDSPWFFGRYGFALRNQAPIAKPFPFKGRLGLFDAPADVVTQSNIDASEAA